MVEGCVVGVLHVLDASCRDVQLVVWSNLLGGGSGPLLSAELWPFLEPTPSKLLFGPSGYEGMVPRVVDRT